MSYLVPCNSPLSLENLTAQIHKSSNFRFAWQFYHFRGIDAQSPADVRRALDSIIATPELHRFLEDSFDGTYDPAYRIEPLHEHCAIVCAPDEFENILASAAADRLGAYSRELHPANAEEKREISKLFSSIGSYFAYQLVPGNIPDCPTCHNYNNHLFTSWFYGVAWDWCLFATWPARNLLWMGCLTDTD